MREPEIVQRSSLPGGSAIDPSLAAQALLCASGELEGEEAAAFERRLAEDQSAREALVQAVQLTQALADGPPSLPNPTYRDRVRQRLLPRRSGRPWRSIILGAVGTIAATLLVGLWLWQSSSPTLPDVPARVASPDQGPSLNEAILWTELQNSNHLSRALEEKKRRKGRTDESTQAPSEYRSWRLLNHSSIKH
jgi:hypothetical protein